MTFDSTVIADGVYIGTFPNTSKIYVDYDGVYNIQFSAQLVHTGGGGSGNVVSIWLRKNGIDVPWSNTNITVPSNAPYVVAAWNFMIDLLSGQYIQLMWSSDNAAFEIYADPGPITLPVRPNIPSVILTVQQVR